MIFQKLSDLIVCAWSVRHLAASRAPEIYVTLNHGALAIAYFSLSKLAGKTNIVTSVALLAAKLNLADLSQATLDVCAYPA
jgi:hypothetical protein